MSNNKSVDLDSVHVARGKIEHVNEQNLRGWVYLESGQVPRVKIVVNGHELPTITTDIDRPELQGKIGTDLRCGFSVDLTAAELWHHQKINRIEVTELNSGYRFDQDIFYYCPLVRIQTKVLKSVFFAEYYRNCYDLASLSNEEAFTHYIKRGIYLDNDPNPWFSNRFFKNNYSHKLNEIDIPILSYLNIEFSLKISASEHFDASYYSINNPDLSTTYGLLDHYVNYGHREGRRGVESTLPDTIHKETELLSQLEPKLALYFSSEKKVIEYPKLSATTYVPRLISNRLGNDIKAVICVPYLSYGGADLISTYMLKAFQQVYGDKHVLLIVTDRSENVVEQWISEETQIIYLDEEAKYSNLKEKVKTLHSIIGLLSPDKVFNVNSHACWEMYKVFGRQLATVIDLYAYLFCFDYSSDNQISGYIKDYIPKTVKYLKRVCCDNQTVIDDMRSLYGFSEENADVFKSVYVPIPDNLKRIAPDQASPYSKNILWASRLARQKQPDILLQIAAEMPDYTFIVYGPPGDSHASATIVENKTNNIEYRGVFDNIEDVNLQEYSLFLNTSAWDGLPTILIQIMGAGLPIVTSNVGGISELVNCHTGTCIQEHADSQEYCKAIKKALINYEDSLGKAEAGLEIIKGRHNWISFFNRLKSIGLFDDLSTSTRRVVPYIDRRKYGS